MDHAVSKMTLIPTYQRRIWKMGSFVLSDLEQVVESAGDGANIGGLPCGVVGIAVAVWATPAG